MNFVKSVSLYIALRVASPIPDEHPDTIAHNGLWFRSSSFEIRFFTLLQQDGNSILKVT